jgi:hypothetical protein
MTHCFQAEVGEPIGFVLREERHNFASASVVMLLLYLVNSHRRMNTSATLHCLHQPSRATKQKDYYKESESDCLSI